MRQSLIKTAMLTLPLLAPFASLQAAVAPPIMDLKIFMAEGNGNIFANGKMQAAVSIGYQLAAGEKIIKTTFREFKSFENIEDLGWDSTSIDNGYRHSITSNLNTIKPTVNTEITYYLSTYNTVEDDICVEVETDSGYKLDTCESSVDSDYVTLTPLKAITYDSKDFYLKKLKQTSSSAEKIALYGLYKNADVAAIRAVSHTIANPSGMVIQADSRQSTIQDYSIYETTSSYTGTFLLDTGIATFSTLGPNSTNNNPWNITYAGNTPIVGVLNYQLHSFRFLLDDKSCNPGTYADTFDCIDPSVAGDNKYYPIPESDLNHLTHTSQYLALTDEYGTESSIKLRYGSGSDNDDPFIAD
ncbi:hypothetical protein [Psychromonas sp. Urea-02u-13]|uniref:hypothetical protein n=1 Tax=Psychromonas sp. Urea-02u-13 TaxID=2058326 RepID=UPI000C32DAA9|nr:hypothetical protein [Psychromonas sp. Urea-02u-13]PKG37144.1 hypothetical protein CXF74_20400 [Psychromonas sp. Urea-02u-13]